MTTLFQRHVLLIDSVSNCRWWNMTASPRRRMWRGLGASIISVSVNQWHFSNCALDNLRRQQCAASKRHLSAGSFSNYSPACCDAAFNTRVCVLIFWGLLPLRRRLKDLLTCRNYQRVIDKQVWSTGPPPPSASTFPPCVNLAVCSDAPGEVGTPSSNSSFDPASFMPCALLF